MSLKAVAFDLFGTLVDGNRLPGPYDGLISELALDYATCRNNVLTTNLSLREIAEAMIAAPLSEIQQRVVSRVEDALSEDLAGLYLYPETMAVLKLLKDAGIKIGIISNLGKPYGDAALKLLEGIEFDAVLFSYQEGLIKPDLNIYRRFANYVGEEIEDILMIGDRERNDLVAPLEAGMKARLLVRDKDKFLQDRSPDQVQSLLEIPELLGIEVSAPSARSMELDLKERQFQMQP